MFPLELCGFPSGISASLHCPKNTGALVNWSLIGCRCEWLSLSMCVPFDKQPKCPGLNQH